MEITGNKFALIGLGDFGAHLAMVLSEKGAEVLAIDQNMDNLEEVKDSVAHTVCLDATEEKALSSQGIDEYDAVIVCIGDEFEETLLVVTVLQSLGVKRIIARATTPRHAQILRHLQIKEVILPAVDAADRLANKLLFQSKLSSLELSSDYEIIEVDAPDKFVGKNLRELELRVQFDVSLITIKRIELKPRLLGGTREVEHIIGIPSPETVIERGDVLMLFGKKESVQKMMAD